MGIRVVSPQVEAFFLSSLIPSYLGWLSVYGSLDCLQIAVKKQQLWHRFCNNFSVAEEKQPEK